MKISYGKKKEIKKGYNFLEEMPITNETPKEEKAAKKTVRKEAAK